MSNDYKRVAIAGYEGEYEVDTLGNVFSLKSNKVLKPCDFGSKYYVVSLSKNGVRKVCTPHRLVAQAFIPNPNNLPQVNHKDEDKHNNKVENLEWCDASYNMRYGTCIERANATRALHPTIITDEERAARSDHMKAYWSKHKHPLKTKNIECVNDHKAYHSYCEVERAYGIHRKTVKAMCETGKTINGLSFEYAE